jgi:hypothetical protein
MLTPHSKQTSVNFDQTELPHISDDSGVHSHCMRNYILIFKVLFCDCVTHRLTVLFWYMGLGLRVVLQGVVFLSFGILLPQTISVMS